MFDWVSIRLQNNLHKYGLISCVLFYQRYDYLLSWNVAHNIGIRWSAVLSLFDFLLSLTAVRLSLFTTQRKVANEKLPMKK